jgi:peptide/nickel transport system substrate-binding protein
MHFDKTLISKIFIRVLLYLLVLSVLSYGIAYFLFFAKNNITLGFLSSPRQQGIIGSVQTLNPLFVQPFSLEHALSQLFFTGLTQYNEQNQITGALGESWDVREGGKEFLFHIRQDAFWSDNSQITAHDVVFTYRLMQSENYHGWAKDFFKGVEIELIDDFTILFKLPTEFMPFLDTLTFPVLPRKYFLGDTIEQVQPVTFTSNGVFYGAFALQEINVSTLPDGTAYRRLTFKNNATQKSTTLMIFNNEQQLQTAFKLGIVDEMVVRNLADFEEVTDDGHMIASRSLIGQHTVLLVNNEKVDDVKTRKAIAQAIDKTALEGDPAEGPLPRQSPFWGELAEFRVGFDPKAAEEVLAGKTYRLVTLHTPQLKNTAETLRTQLGAVGVAVVLEVVPTQEAFDTIITERNFELLLLSQHVGRDPDVYSFWHSSQIEPPGLNLVGLKNRRVDKALEQGRSNPDFELRKEFYTEFQSNFLEQYPAIFLTHPYVYIISKQVNDHTPPSEIWELSDLWLQQRG